MLKQQWHNLLHSSIMEYWIIRYHHSIIHINNSKEDTMAVSKTNSCESVPQDIRTQILEWSISSSGWKWDYALLQFSLLSTASIYTYFHNFYLGCKCQLALKVIPLLETEFYRNWCSWMQYTPVPRSLSAIILRKLHA